LTQCPLGRGFKQFRAAITYNFLHVAFSPPGISENKTNILAAWNAKHNKNALYSDRIVREACIDKVAPVFSKFRETYGIQS
jgi:hypothetical protein